MALRLLDEDQDFDVIICDLMMPEMCGQDFYFALRELAPSLAERAAFITGGAFTSSAQQFLSSVANPRLSKPFEPQMLLALVDDIIQRQDTTPHAASPVMQQ
jgi:CheY-like chemotaxis protein